MIKSASTNDRRSELSIAFAIAFAGACAMAALAVVVPAYGAPKPAPAPRRAANRCRAAVTEPAPPTATLDRIRSAGKIVLGYRADAAPMSSRDASGQPVGYSIALCSKVADALKQELRLPSLVVDWVAVSAGYADLEQRKVDLVCAADEVTLAHRAVGVVFDSGVSGRDLGARSPRCVRRVAAHARGTSATVPAVVARHDPVGARRIARTRRSAVRRPSTRSKRASRACT